MFALPCARPGYLGVVLLTLLSLALAQEAPTPDDGALAVVPFGVAHYAWNRPVRGVVYSVTQAAGIGVGIYSTVVADAALANGDSSTAEQWQAVTGAAIGVAALSYAVQVLDGSRLAQLRATDAHARREAVEAFDAGLALAGSRR